ncbi:MAG: DUF935 family protein [Betaproteobacteria bacterium]|nr:DUF935 family protein [Betaproteobacteria bacterium]
MERTLKPVTDPQTIPMPTDTTKSSAVDPSATATALPDSAPVTAPVASTDQLQNQIASLKSDPWFAGYTLQLKNADPILATRGQGRGLAIYEEIERDTQVYSALEKRKLQVIAKPWQVTPPADPTPDEERLTALVKAQLDALNFDALCLNLLGALLKGFAVGEIMWEVRGRELWAKEVLPRPQRRFAFDADYNLRVLTRDNLMPGALAPLNKFIVHSFGVDDGHPYGRGLGHRLYWPVYFKRQGISFWLLFIEKFAAPTVVGKYPVGTSQADQKLLLEASKAVTTDAGIIIPEGMTIELLEAARSGGIDSYEKLVRYMDEQIDRCVLGQTDSSRSAGGAQKAASDNRRDENNLRAQADSDLLTTTLQRDLIRAIGDFNVPGARLPRVWRDFGEADDLDSRSQIDERLMKMGFSPADIKYINDTYGGEWVRTEPSDPSAQRGSALAGVSTNTTAERTSATPAFAAGDLPGAAGDGVQNVPDTADAYSEQLARNAEVALQMLVTPLRELVMQATSYDQVREGVVALYAALPSEQLAVTMEQALLAAELAGRFEISRGAEP